MQILFSDSFLPPTQNKVPVAGTRTENNSPSHAFAKDQPRHVSSWHADAEKASFPCPPAPSGIHSPAACPMAADTKQVAGCN